jgi:phage protein D
VTALVSGQTAIAARRATPGITWQGKDITRDLAPDLLSIGYADNLTGAADDLTLELQDRAGLWSSSWRPTFGDTVVARLQAEPWLTNVRDLRLGLFAHDKIGISGPPKAVHLSCVSAPLATGLRRRKRTRAWKGVTLKQIASDIADRAGLSLSWDGPAGLTYTDAHQVDKSDLEFLEDLCHEVGRDLKVTEDKIVAFEEMTRDSAEPIGELSLSASNVLDYSFDSDDSARYGSCVITFFDPRSGKTRKGQWPRDGQVIEGLDPNGQTLELRMPADSGAQAEKKAEALLRRANAFAGAGRISCVGDLGLVAGVTFNLTDAFGFDGKFIIAKAEHHVGGGEGYTCALAVRRCLEGY